MHEPEKDMKLLDNGMGYTITNLEFTLPQKTGLLSRLPFSKKDEWNFSVTSEYSRITVPKQALETPHGRAAVDYVVRELFQTGG